MLNPFHFMGLQLHLLQKRSVVSHNIEKKKDKSTIPEKKGLLLPGARRREGGAVLHMP